MNDPDPHRALSEMEARIKKVRGDDKLETQQADGSTGVAFRIGIDLISGVGFGIFVGIMLDKWLNTAPWLLIVFLVLGFGAGIRNVLRTAQSLEQENKNK